MDVDMWYLATRLFSTQMVCERTHMSYSFFPLFFFFLILAIARKRGHCSVVLEDGVMRLFEMRVMVYTPKTGWATVAPSQRCAPWVRSGQTR